MWTKALSLITSKAAGPVASAVAAGLMAALVFVSIGAKATEAVLHGQIGGLERKATRIEGEREAAKSDLVTCRANEKTLDASVTLQNNRLTALRAEGERRVAEADRAAQAARAASAKAVRDAKAILAAKPTADICASADALILGSLK